MMEIRGMDPLCLKEDKQIYADRDMGRALSMLHIPNRRTLERVLYQREALISEIGRCAYLNLPVKQRVEETDDGFILIEEMNLCTPDGPMEHCADDLLEALRTMHGSGWVHMDVKPEHLLWANGHWQLHDFDGAMRIGETFRERDITYAYAPPDVLWHTRAEASDDLYAAALMLYRWMNGGKLPFEGKSERIATFVRFLGVAVAVPEAWGEEARRFFRKALSVRRKNRFHSSEEFINAWKRVELARKMGV